LTFGRGKGETGLTSLLMVITVLVASNERVFHKVPPGAFGNSCLKFFDLISLEPSGKCNGYMNRFCQARRLVDLIQRSGKTSEAAFPAETLVFHQRPNG